MEFVQTTTPSPRKAYCAGCTISWIRTPSGKLVRCVEGEVFDVAVDIRRSSPTFGKWVGAVLSAENKRQLWIPEGFAHGFMALSETVQFVYKATNYYAPQSERSIIWNDPEIGIDWPALSDCALSLSEKDLQAHTLATAEVYK